MADKFGPHQALWELQQRPGSHAIFNPRDDYSILFVICMGGFQTHPIHGDTLLPEFPILTKNCDFNEDKAEF